MKAIKNIITATALILTAASLSSCYFRISKEQKARLKNDIRYALCEDMDKDTLTIDAGEFHAISQEGLDDLIFVQTDDEYKVEIIAYSETSDYVSVNNNNGVLRIKFNDSLSTLRPVQAWVYAPSISEISTAGSGDITLTDYTGDSLTIKAAGSGNLNFSDIRLSGDLTISSAGSGDHDFERIYARNMSISKAGSSDGEYKDINVGELTVSSSGSGDSEITGKALSASLMARGSGNIDASELKSQSTHSDSKGSGAVRTGD